MAQGISFKFKIEGEEELARKMDPDKIMAKPIKNLLTQAALHVERKAKEKADFKMGYQTGRLRSSITHKIDPASMPLWAKVGTPVFYGRFLEYGTIYMDAQPFLHPALEDSKEKINSLLKDAAKDIEDNYKK